MRNYHDVENTPVASDDDVLALIRDLVGRAIRRQNWLMFLDSENRPLALVMPMDDYPMLPEGDDAPRFAEAIASVMETVDAAQVILTWERPGRPQATPADIAWARAMATTCRDQGIRVRGQLISHTEGVRWFAPDDYL